MRRPECKTQSRFPGGFNSGSHTGAAFNNVGKEELGFGSHVQAVDKRKNGCWWPFVLSVEGCLLMWWSGRWASPVGRTNKKRGLLERGTGFLLPMFCYRARSAHLP
jgi:hypothetical protein